MSKVSKFFKTKFLAIFLSVTAVLTTVGAAAFVSTDKGNFAPKYQSVAYINTDTPVNSYYTIEEALYNSKANDTIYVRPGANPVLLGRNNDPAYVTVKPDVTLDLPLTIDTAGKVYNGWTVREGQAVKHGVSDIDIYSSSTKNQMANRLEIGENVTLYNYGTILIGGELNGGQADVLACGNTQGLYSEILMRNNSKIFCGTPDSTQLGVIKCLGYIREVEGCTRSDLKVFNGKVIAPFLVRDFRGGSASLSIYWPYVPTFGRGSQDAISPFNQYEVRNIEPYMTIYYNGKLDAYCNIHAGGQQNDTIGTIIGNSPKAVIQFTDLVNSRLVSKYNRKTEICEMDIYGGAKMNSLSLNITVDIKLTQVVVTLDTGVVFFPLTWRHHLHLHPNENQSSATFNIEKRLKMLPGSYIEVDKGAILKTNEITILDHSDSNPRTNPGFNDSQYVISGQDYTNPATYPESVKPAQMIVKGELVANRIGGFITAAAQNAILSINVSPTITTYEATEAAYKGLGKAEQDPIVNPARGNLNSNTTVSNLSALSYISHGDYWFVNNIDYTVSYYQYYQDTKQVTAYTSTSNPTAGNTTEAINLGAPNHESDASYKFAGWYLGLENGEVIDNVPENNLTGSLVASHLDANKHLNVYVKWAKAREVNVSYKSPEGITSRIGNYNSVGYTGVDYVLPESSLVTFDRVIGTDVAHDFVLTSWAVQDQDGNVIPGFEQVSGSILIPENYEGNTIYIVPNTLALELYKIQITGAKAGNAEIIHIYINGVDKGALGEGVLWEIGGTTVSVMLDWWGFPYNQIRVEITKIKGGESLFEANNKSGGWGDRKVRSGDYPLDADGIKLNFVKHK